MADQTAPSNIPGVAALTKAQRRSFQRRGVLTLRGRLKPEVIEPISSSLPDAATRPGSTVFETDGSTIRAMHGLHLDNEIYREFARLPELLRPAQELLNGEVYLYQFKVNFKAAFNGDLWPWHDDYIFWRNLDGLPRSDILTVAVFLDDVSDFNGPMYFIPGSHLQMPEQEPETPRRSPSWVQDVSADLSYQTDSRFVSQLVASHGAIPAKGPRGTVVFFHSRIVHASGGNLSPMDRRIAFLTYSRADNYPTRLLRPEFLVSRDFAPWTPSEGG